MSLHQEGTERGLRELADRIERYAAGPVEGCALPRVTLICADAPGDIQHELLVPVVCLVVAGEKEVQLEDRVLTYRPGTFVVSAVDVPITGRITRTPYRAVALHLAASPVADLLIDETEIQTPSAERPLEVGRASQDLVEAMCRLLRLLDDPQDLRALASGSEREVLYRALRSPGGYVIRAFARQGRLASRVDAAVAWIREHPARRLRVEDLAQSANLSPSTLYRHFRAATGLSPLQFQKQIRLQEARKLLLLGRTTAAGAAAQVGYASPSHFHRDYLRLFGSTPGADAVDAVSVPSVPPSPEV